MPQPLLYLLLLLFLFILPSPSSPQSNCTPYPLFANRIFSTCISLPGLCASLRFTFNSSNSTLSLAFSTPSSGWVAWGLGRRMAGAQALITYRLENGSLGINTFNIIGYNGPISPSRIAVDVLGLEAKADQQYGGGLVAVFATVKLPPGVGKVNQVWQVGPVGPAGSIGRHALAAENLQSVGVLDLVSGRQSSQGVNGGEKGLNKREIHGILNAVSWGILLPIGAMIARWLKEFIPESPAWFYLHISCQLIGYSVGVAGWATGLHLGRESVGSTPCIEILVLALFMRPNKEHKYRMYWNAYHHFVGYMVILLGVYNVFRGLGILNPYHMGRDAYIVVLCCLGVVVILLELRSWCSLSDST